LTSLITNRKLMPSLLLRAGEIAEEKPSVTPKV
jgi:hypothetical protein